MLVFDSMALPPRRSLNKDLERAGPYYPMSGPVPLQQYRAFKRGKDNDALSLAYNQTV
ncbi:hypothetical protein PS691_03911 [Pseudomonas fluorescens]|uniref:Uncharacterized protein n=1 Tax=Pseudomonas fluorescens TaxID=294 RepID=A0A5E7DIZ8_PSEFL|nr:hypothetical protein PS691_03911 [Pseudomonas fluorescens]